MDSVLRPRDIQQRIRAGQSIEDVAELSGMPIAKVQIFAGPVLAEREHVARQAMAATVRRRGETSGHRQLATTMSDRLASRQIDDETLDWDSAKMDDGRWSVTATFDSGDAQRQAIFYFDVRGRFSVAANDEARWVLGEQTAAGSRSGSSAGDLDPFDADNEPTIDLSDELALVRATQDRKRRGLVAVESDEAPGTESSAEETSDEDSSPRQLHPVDDEWDAAAAAEEEAAYAELQQPAETEEEQAEFDEDRADTDRAEDGQPDADQADADQAEEESTSAADAEPEATEQGEDSETTEPERSPAEKALTGDADDGDLGTLYAMLGGDGYSEDSTRVYSGLSDASAVPETDNAGWEPAITVDYPVEPSLLDDEEEHLFSDQPEIMRTARSASARSADSAPTPGSPKSPAQSEQAAKDETSEAASTTPKKQRSAPKARKARKADAVPDSTPAEAPSADVGAASESTAAADTKTAAETVTETAAETSAATGETETAPVASPAAETEPATGAAPNAGLSRAARRRRKRKESRKAAAAHQDEAQSAATAAETKPTHEAAAPVPISGAPTEGAPAQAETEQSAEPEANPAQPNQAQPNKAQPNKAQPNKAQSDRSEEPDDQPRQLTTADTADPTQPQHSTQQQSSTQPDQAAQPVQEADAPAVAEPVAPTAAAGSDQGPEASSAAETTATSSPDAAAADPSSRTEETHPEETQPEQAQPERPNPPEQKTTPAKDSTEKETPTEDGEEKPKPKKAAKRKRASVPSWDEIMFGGPPRK